MENPTYPRDADAFSDEENQARILIEEYRKFVDLRRENLVRNPASTHLEKFPDQLLLPNPLPDGRQIVPVRQPTGVLLSIYDILPSTLNNAAVRTQQGEHGGKQVPSHLTPIRISEADYFRKLRSMAEESLFVGFSYSDLEIDETGDSVWLADEFAQGRLEPVLPEHLVSFVSGALKNYVLAWKIPPTDYWQKFPGYETWDFKNSVTGWCLNQAAASWAVFWNDYDINKFISRTAASQMSNLFGGNK